MRTRSARPWLSGSVVILGLLCAASCSDSDTKNSPASTPEAGAAPEAGSGGVGAELGGAGGVSTTAGAGGEGALDPGALVQVNFSSQVGVLLDELPASIRDRAAETLLAKPDSFWMARAKRQLTLSSYRLNFRPAFYDQVEEKRQLPLPPEEQFEITLVPKDGTKARRAQVTDHDYVLVDYTLASMILTDVASPGLSEPALANVGGSWDEHFIFPIDPELLVQRTGFACMDEAEFPPNSVDTEDVEFFYDQECQVEDALTKTGCHYTQLASESCVDALDLHVGKVEGDMHYERLPWDGALADKYRLGAVSNPTGADLEVLGSELAINRVTYRYIEPTSCSLAEQCVGGKGWRRLLQFNASEKNTGVTPVDIGNVDYFLDDPDNPTPNANHHVYEYSTCHQHYHFSHYARFTYGDDATLGSKRAFCLESVARYSNNEHSPTWSPYNDCAYQGISQGWGDQYNAGIECQWVDVTTIDTSSTPVTAPLGLVSNPDGFMCEGEPVYDSDGNLEWVHTEFKDAQGDTVDKPRCDYMADWDANNSAELDVTLPLPGEGMITEPCNRGQIGPHRNCGFSYDHQVRSCTPGASLTLHCAAASAGEPQIVRICEASAVLGAGVACTDADALASGTVLSDTPTSVVFTCPAGRDPDEPGGKYALYTAPTLTEDDALEIDCTAD